MKTIKAQTHSLTFSKLIDNFTLAAQLESKAPRAIEQYKGLLLPFAVFIRYSPYEVQVSHIRSFLGNFKQQRLAQSNHLDVLQKSEDEIMVTPR